MNPVEQSAVEFSLLRQTSERVFVAFEFVTDQLAIYDCYIDADRTRPNAHLFDDAGIMIASVLRCEQLTNS